MAIDKVVERLSSLNDSEEIIARLQIKNQKLDEELQAYENENRELDELLMREQFSDMRLVEQTQKQVRNLLKAEQCDDNDIYSGFARRWNGYLRELAEPPTATDLEGM